MLSIQYHEFAASCASTDAYYIDTNQLKGGVVMVVRVDVQVWSVQAEQLYSCNQNLLDLVLDAFQLVAFLQDLHSGGGGALQGLGSLGV